MKHYYYMNKENGNLVTWDEMWEEALELDYDEMVDPTSYAYGEWQHFYEKTKLEVEE